MPAALLAMFALLTYVLTLALARGASVDEKIPEALGEDAGLPLKASRKQ